VLDNPQIVEELDVADFILENGVLLALYSPHTLTGSIDTLVSYNVDLAGGSGYYVSATIGQYYNDTLAASQNGSFLDYFHDFTAICNNEVPLPADDLGEATVGEAITICLLDNDVDPENELDPASLSLISMPPVSEGTVSLDVDTGCLIFAPNEDFMGNVTPFEYEICDIGKYVPAYKGDANSLPVPAPDPENPDILVTPSICNTGTIFINVIDGTTDITTTSYQANFNLNVFPNPADDALNISYVLPENADVSITLLSVLGQPIQELEPETLQMGAYTTSFDTSELNEGNYFVMLNINGETVTKGVQIK